MLDAKRTVNGLVMALEKPNPQATIDTIKPVNESYPIDTASITIIGRSVSISSNKPRIAPNNMKIRLIRLSNKNFLLINFLIILPIITLIPKLSFIA